MTKKRGGSQAKAESIRIRILCLIFHQIRMSPDIKANHKPIDIKQRVPRNKGHLQQTDRQTKQKTLLSKECFALFLYTQFCKNPRRTTTAEMNGGWKKASHNSLHHHVGRTTTQLQQHNYETKTRYTWNKKHRLSWCWWWCHGGSLFFLGWFGTTIYISQTMTHPILQVVCHMVILKQT